MESWHPQEEQHRRKELHYWRWTILFAGIATTAASVAAGFAFYALKVGRDQAIQSMRQADIAKDAYLASTRAWMDVSIDASTLRFVWDKTTGASIKVGLVGINNGNSPALNASVRPSLAIGGILADSKSLVISNCNESIALWGRILFMKEEVRSTLFGSVMPAEIQSNRDQIIDLQIRGESPGDISFYVVACAQYKIIGDDRDHHTGRVFQLVRLPDTPNGAASYRSHEGDRVPEGHLDVIDVDQGSYSD